MLSLSEKLLLLGLHDEKGHVVLSASTALPYGLCGAILLELYLSQKIVFKGKHIQACQPFKTSNDIHTDTLKLIADSSKLRDTKYWVQKLQSKLNNLQERIATNLVDKKILEKEEHSFLWLIHYNRFPTHDEKAELDIRNRLFDIVLKRSEPDQEDIALISLVLACDLVNEIFDKADRKKARQRMTDISEKTQVSRAIAHTLEEIKNAIMTVIITSAVTTTVIST